MSSVVRSGCSGAPAALRLRPRGRSWQVPSSHHRITCAMSSDGPRESWRLGRTLTDFDFDCEAPESALRPQERKEDSLAGG